MSFRRANLAVLAALAAVGCHGSMADPPRPVAMAATRPSVKRAITDDPLLDYVDLGLHELDEMVRMGNDVPVAKMPEYVQQRKQIIQDYQDQNQQFGGSKR